MIRRHIIMVVSFVFFFQQLAATANEGLVVGQQTHQVKKGENLSTILKVYGLVPLWGADGLVNEAIRLNPELIPRGGNLIFENQVLLLPNTIPIVGDVSSPPNDEVSSESPSVVSSSIKHVYRLGGLGGYSRLDQRDEVGLYKLGSDLQSGLGVEIDWQGDDCCLNSVKVSLLANHFKSTRRYYVDSTQTPVGQVEYSYLGALGSFSWGGNLAASAGFLAVRESGRIKFTDRINLSVGPHVEKSFSLRDGRSWGVRGKVRMSIYENLSSTTAPSFFFSPSLFFKAKGAQLGADRVEIRLGYEFDSFRVQSVSQVNQTIFFAGFLEYGSLR